MLLKKNKYNLLVLFSFFQISFSQSYLPNSQINFDELSIPSKLIPDLIVSSNGQLILLDKQNHRLARILNDSLLVAGGFGSSKYGLFDPVDLIADHLDIFILDQSTGRISRFDSKLNFIQFFDYSIDYPKYPTLFSIDSRRNFYFYSPDEDIVYTTQSLSDKISNFSDLSLDVNTASCLKDISINLKDQIAMLFSCNDELFIFNRAGRLQRKFKINIVDPLKVFSINEQWSVINSKGKIQSIDSAIIELSIDNKVIVDIHIEKNQLYILTKTEIHIFDTHGFYK